MDTAALLHALNGGQIAQCVIDVWEYEPHINLELLERTYIGTPHIAGYSADGKANATRMSLEALTQEFHLGPVPPIVPPPLADATLQAIKQAPTHAEALLVAYNPHTDSQALKSAPERFEQLRGDYPLRRELLSCEL